MTTSSGTTEYRHNILADGQVIAVHTIDVGGSASTSYLHYDQLGSVDAITNDQGSVIQSMSFDAFGNRRLTTSWDYGVSQNTLATLNNYTNRGYTDQEELDNLSLVDMNGRVYDPEVGRFISGDPVEGSNRYAYVYDNPMNATDPSGFRCKDGNADNGQPGCDDQDNTIQLLPVNVNSPGSIVLAPVDVSSIGDNTGEAGATDLGNCGCVENAPGTGSGSMGGAQASGGTVYLLPVNDTATRLPPPTPYYTLHPINPIPFDFLFVYAGPQFFNNLGTTCSSGLAGAGGKTLAAIARADVAWGTISQAAQANGVSATLLAAIGVRESGFENVPQLERGSAIGVLQIDLSEHPDVTAAEAYDFPWAANFAARLLASDEASMIRKFPSFNAAELLQATAAAYNAGPGRVGSTHDMIDSKTTGHNYGADVSEIGACFQ